MIGKLPVNDITPDHIVAIMNAADAAGLRYTGYRLRAHLAAIFNTAIARRDRDALRGNPCDAGLIAAFRPGKFKADDEHYARIELTDAPLAIEALREARKAADGSLMTAALDCLAVHDRDRPEAL